ncbi:hypothetical protein [Bathymodiolus platifrons methanotrophic gill symbiont]|uniref:hypothetical protein n=1 Tax=Bathymodiolus platifrons methanotrophic gill symbiont TaxID=113268 RepID=UPI000B415579|nr:hypothetical protein [Bathymodiolus platifrons methanotrophic gill symbiont]
MLVTGVPECCEVAWRACFNLVGTWCTLGGLHPQDMVNEAVKEYFKKVFHLEKQAKGNGQI